MPIKFLQNRVPRMSATERAALEAGDVWIDAELFSGRPDFRRILAESYPRLTQDERAFLDGPVEEACRRTNPFEVDRTGHLPPEVWAFLKEHHFFGLGLPKRYGGHGFSSLAMSAIFGKLVSRSSTLSTVVLIPNSVGPGELLLEVGTEEQRERYLPRLARGDEIPCFALTEPEAGSDAASLTSRGEIFCGDDDELHIRLDWEKRYITLAPVATLLGLAFRLFDPENLLGKGEDLGITCALVPTGLPGVEIGRQHDLLGVPFPNGPTRGQGVVVPLGSIIGGPEHAGRGWPMLMEALSGGRAVSLPAQAVAGAKHVARVAGAYSLVRRQFGLPIARFEGIEEPLARIASMTYLLEAGRVFTCGALDSGHRPSVISAIIKYQTTELVRELVRDGMDIQGGAGICLGPNNVLARGHTGSPIGVTVEGANILTRTLIIFGQGALRCHPYAHRLLEAIRHGRPRHLLGAFGGLGLHLLRNLGRALRLELSRGRLTRAPVDGPTARHYRRLAWASVRFALAADLAMLSLGGKLKQRGKLSGRLADMLGWLYLGTATLRRYEAEQRRAEDLPLVDWGLHESLSRAQQALEGLLENFDAPLVGPLVRGPLHAWVRFNRLAPPPPDRLGSQAARTLLRPGAQRDRLIGGLFSDPKNIGSTRLERAFELAAQASGIEAKIRRAVREGRLERAPYPELIEAAINDSILREEEGELLTRAAEACREAVRVDSFSPEELAVRRGVDAPPEPGVAAVR